MDPIVLSAELLETLRVRYQLLADCEKRLAEVAQTRQAIDDSIMHAIWSALGLDARTQNYRLDLNRGLLIRVETPNESGDPSILD